MHWQSGEPWPDADVDSAELWRACGAKDLTAVGVTTPDRLVRQTVGIVRFLDAHGAELAKQFGSRGLGLLTRRAQLLGLARSGQISCGGATRLLRAADEWIAVTLARLDDWAALPAWLGVEVSALPAIGPELWNVVADVIAKEPARQLVDFGRELGYACAIVGESSHPRPSAPVALKRLGSADPLPLRGMRVANLSSLWAGPLAAEILQRLGADIVCIESVARPDGSRATPDWFNAMHRNQRFVSVDFQSDTEVASLRELLAGMDVVIEGSRPRALEQLGIDAASIVAGDGPRVWLSITGHGRQLPAGMRVGFGDDAAVAGGLVGWLPAGPVFVADAVADPLAGLAAAAAAVDLLARGDRWLVEIALSRVASFNAN